MSSSSSADSLDANLVVLGGGIAGMTVAAYAAVEGLRVILIEKASELGGSAVLSNGALWAPTDLEAFASCDPHGNREVHEVLVSGYEESVRWIESLSVALDPEQPPDDFMGYPRTGRMMDIFGYINRCKNVIQASNGWVLTNAQVDELIAERSKVVGVVARDRDGAAEVRCGAVVLATGGLQGDAGMRKSYIGGFASDLALRSNRYSTGGGLRLGLSMGADVHRSPRFYGQLMPPILREYEPRDFGRLAQRYSQFGVLFDSTGGRFVDESLSYYGNAFAVSQLTSGRALLVGDEVARGFTRSAPGGVEPVDGPSEAEAEGARVAIADSWTEIARAARSWGYADIAPAVNDFNRAAAEGSFDGGPGRRKYVRPLDSPPFFAVEVRPAITFAFSGLRVRGDGHVLTKDGDAIGGLLAAGVDIGVYDTAYGGGLALGLSTGLAAAKTALRQMQG